MEDTWNPRDWRVLDTAVRLLDADAVPGSSTPLHQIVSETGLSEDDVIRALKTLEGNFLQVDWLAPARAARVRSATDTARIAVGQWPSPRVAADRLIAALQHLEASETDEVQRGKIRKALDAITSAGRDFAIELGAAVVGHTITGS